MKERSSMKIEKIPLWSKEITKDVVPKILHLYPYFGICEKQHDHCVYSKEEGGHFIYVSLYDDDMLLVRDNNMDAIKEMKMSLSSKFDMKGYLCVLKFILGMEIKRDWVVRKICLNQRK
jgi:hypothetical protein